MSDDVDVEVVHALCQEANVLAKGLSGPVQRVSIQAGDYRVELEWDHTPAVPAGTVMMAAAPAGHAVPAAGAGAPAEDTSHLHPVLALLVGTFYRAPEPGSPAFVEVGDVVEAGQDVAIIEAMKVMNRIQADRPGRVAEILVNNGDFVEFNEKLILLEPLEG